MRTFRLEIDDLSIDAQLKCIFKANITSATEFNTLSLDIYNLSESSRNQRIKYGSVIKIYAGYDINDGLLFSGNIALISHAHDSGDWVTSIDAIDAMARLQTISVSKTFPKNTSYKNIISELCALIDTKAVGIDAVITQAIKKSTVGPYSMNGFVVDELIKLCDMLNSSWALVNTEFRMFPRDTYIDDKTISIPQFTADNGLIGSVKTGGYDTKSKLFAFNARVLLNSSLKIGQKIRVNNNDFRIDKIQHIGDSLGTEWYSDLTLVSIPL